MNSALEQSVVHLSNAVQPSEVVSIAAFLETSEESGEANVSASNTRQLNQKWTTVMRF
jgi:hypothetical protein